MRGERPNLWDAIYAVAGGLNAARDAASIRNDVLWNLRSWPTELVNWPVDNTRRVDIVYELGVTRFGRVHTQSWKGRSPIPANERCQQRWNSNPWDVSDSGSGLSEVDPGAWLLPFWMARWAGIVTADD